MAAPVGRRPRHRSGLRALAVALLATMLKLPVAFAAPWEINEFEVLPVAPAGGVDGAPHMVTALVIRALRETDTFDPDLPGIFDRVDADADTLAVIETFLHESAQQFERWGFPAPALEPVVTGPAGRPAFRVYLINDLQDNAGEYHGSGCGSFRERVILLDAGDIISGGRVTPRGYHTIAHELFHAVQFGSAFFECGREGSVGDWISEGTARAVGWDVAQKLRPMGYSSHEMERWGVRDYNQRLPVPNVTDRNQPKAYGTSSFWRYLAEFHALGTKPGPAENPTDYGYLAQMFSGAPADRDCDGVGAECDGELNWLATQVRQLFGEPLRIIYTNFAEMLAVYGHYRRGIDRGPGGRGDPWRDAVFYFEGCPKVTLRPSVEQRIHEATLNFNYENGTYCFEVDVDGFDRDIILEIKADATGNGLPVRNLNAAIADRPIQARKAQIDALDPQTGRESATWHFELPDQEISFVVLTNMADSPAASTTIEGLPVSLTALQEYARFGTGTAASGPSASEIDAPFNIELPEIRQALVMPGPLELHVNAGMWDVCMMQLQFENPDFGDHLLLKMDQEGPFRTGGYDVHPGGSFKTETFPGQFVTAMTLGPNNPSTLGWTLNYKGMGGVVTLNSVSRHFIKGEATLNMKYAVTSDCIDPSGQRPSLENRIECPPHLENLVVRAEFGVKPEMTRGAERLGLSIERCTEERSGPAGSAPPSGSPGGAPPPGPGGEPAPAPGQGPSSNGGNPQPDPGENAPGGAPSGVGPDPGPAPAPAAGPAPGAGAQWGYLEEEGGSFGTANFLEVVTTGDVEFRAAFPGQALSLVGGCAPGERMSIGMFRGGPQDEDFFQLAFDASAPVGTAETGLVALQEVRWDNGTSPVANMPANMNIRAPNRFTGAGSLELTTHTATLQTRRMIGTLRASIRNHRQDANVELEARFDVNLSCGVTGSG